MLMFLPNGSFFFLMLLTAGLRKNRIYYIQVTIYAKSTAAKNDGGFPSILFFVTISLLVPNLIFLYAINK